MKPLFTIDGGEFLVGDYINRRLGHRYDVWVPTKDSGVDLLVTRKRRRGRAVALQVKFSRNFSIRKEMVEHVLATSWFKLEPRKIRKSRADLWVFVILTLKHEQHFVVIPTRELRRCIPRASRQMWHLYLWVYKGELCYQARGLSKDEQLATMHSTVRDPRRNFTEWLGNWTLLDKLTRAAR